MTQSITVKDIIELKQFGYSRIVMAGNEGLTNHVVWVYQLEKSGLVNHSFSENDFVISTLIGINNTNELYRFIELLIVNNCSGCCVDVSLKNYTIDERILKLCDDNAFPLIVSTTTLQTNELIKAVNSTLMTNYDEFFEEGERYYHNLLEMNGFDIQAIVDYTANYLNVRLAYWHVLSDPVVSCDEMKNVREMFTDDFMSELDSYSRMDAYVNKNLAVMRISVLDEKYAYLIMEDNDESISDYKLHILKRLNSYLTPRVTDAFIKRIEKKHSVTAGWIAYWFDGRMSDYLVKEKLKHYGLKNDPTSYTVCVYKMPTPTEHEDTNVLHDLRLKISVILYRTFRKYGFFTIEYIEGDFLKFVVISPSDMNDWRDVLKKALMNLEERVTRTFGEMSNVRIGVGRPVRHVSHISRSHSGALYCCEMKCTHGEKILQYEKLDLLRIFEIMNSNYILDEYAFNVLGELLNPEHKELLETLRVYIKNDYSKKESSEELFITRQTLYSRLDSLSKILGKGFDKGEKRLAIELAIRSMDYINV